MPHNLFSDPVINTQIKERIRSLQDASLEWDERQAKLGFDDYIVETLAESLDVHAEAYLGRADREDLVPQYVGHLRDVGAALIRKAELRSFLSDPYTEERLRQMAENSDEFIAQKRSLTPTQQEAHICGEVERLRTELRPEALKWQKWKGQLLYQIEIRFEARYRHWAAEARERLRRESEAPATAKSGGVGSAQPSPEDVTFTDSANQRAVIDAFIARVAEAGRRITRKDIWTMAGYTDRTEFERFQRGDTRTTRNAVRNFSRVLAMKPDEFIRALDRRRPPK